MTAHLLVVERIIDYYEPAQELGYFRSLITAHRAMAKVWREEVRPGALLPGYQELSLRTVRINHPEPVVPAQEDAAHFEGDAQAAQKAGWLNAQLGVVRAWHRGKDARPGAPETQSLDWHPLPSWRIEDAADGHLYGMFTDRAAAQASMCASNDRLMQQWVRMQIQWRPDRPASGDE